MQMRWAAAVVALCSFLAAILAILLETTTWRDVEEPTQRLIHLWITTVMYLICGIAALVIEVRTSHPHADMKGQCCPRLQLRPRCCLHLEAACAVQLVHPGSEVSIDQT